MQLNSGELNDRVNQEIETFVEGIKNAECNKVLSRSLVIKLKKAFFSYVNGFKISMEFFTRKKRSWPLNFQFENIPWEIWTIKFDVMELSNENGKEILKWTGLMNTLNSYIIQFDE